MISFIQQILQKHHRWVLGVLLSVIIVSFVFTIGTMPGIAKKRRTVFYGKNLMSRKEMQPILNAVLISSNAVGTPVYSRQQLDYLVLARCALLSQADKLPIPPTSDEALAEFIKTLPGFFDEKKEFSGEKYDNFVTACEKNGFEKSEIRKALLDEQRISALKRAVAGNGIVFDYQLKKALSTLYSEYDLAVANLSYGSFSPEINIDEGALRNFHREHADRYNIPEMVAVSIIRFEAPQVDEAVHLPSEAILREYFQSERSRFNAYPDFESARSEVTIQYLNLESQKLAGQNADEFVSELYRGNIKLNSEEWQNLISKFGVSKRKIAAYSKFKLPKVEGVSEAALIDVCDMDSSRYYSEPFATDFGAAVLIVEGRKEAHASTFDEAKKRVEKDMREEIKASQFKALVERIEAALGGATKSNVTDKFNKFGLTPQLFNEISLKKDGDKLDSEILMMLTSLRDDERVRSVQSGDGVVFVVVLDRQTPSFTAMKKKDNGEIEKRLMTFDRDFCFAEYANWLVEQELGKIK
ncbi:MAG: peptidylprolyl isomerase [Puniceicoccales bacterium]|jgi:hypothetical protein|nr:peptidylprolyl isomerase [Puniceicoccales bacterium]